MAQNGCGNAVYDSVSPGGSRVLRALKVLRVLKIVRLLKLIKFFRQVEKRGPSEGVGVAGVRKSAPETKTDLIDWSWDQNLPGQQQSPPTYHSHLRVIGLSIVLLKSKRLFA